jgi:type IV fimbrial biogenesis protein FimT
MSNADKTHGHRASHGLTALDLVITLAIIALGMATALPALKEFSLNQRMKSSLATVHAGLALARNEAINHSGRVVMCPAINGDECGDVGEWHEGWIIFLDRNDDREHQPDEALLGTGMKIDHHRILSSKHRTRLRFYANGTAPGSNANLTFCDARGAEAARQVSLSASGRIRVRPHDETNGAACEA